VRTPCDSQRPAGQFKFYSPAIHSSAFPVPGKVVLRILRTIRKHFCLALPNPRIIVDMAEAPKKIFLTAQWRHLAMLNFEIAPTILKPWLPAGTELDLWNGKTLVSVVGFLFLQTRVWRIAFPFHRNFEEVNLRFYVRRKAPDGWRRGVVFIKEIVPRAVIAHAARRFYNENYVCLPMRHALTANSAEYFWQFRSRQNRIKVTTQGEPQQLQLGSEAEFITEHYWGYSRQPDGSTMEYKVEHPRWRVANAVHAGLDCDVTGLYGEPFKEAICAKPCSAFLADGSPVTVYCGERLTL
jgi:uncharacterized protein